MPAEIPEPWQLEIFNRHCRCQATREEVLKVAMHHTTPRYMADTLRNSLTFDKSEGLSRPHTTEEAQLLLDLCAGKLSRLRMQQAVVNPRLGTKVKGIIANALRAMDRDGTGDDDAPDAA
jgi:hypothetical protein